jgi:uncharacterized damage-inducible protein DinB
LSVAEGFLPELDAEIATTRRLIERLPADRLNWKPHPKSKSLEELATHVVEQPRWGLRIEAESFAVGSEKAPSMKTAADFLARLDANAAAGRAAIARRTDADMLGEFRVLRPDGTVFFAISRQALIRRILLNHMIHHRGQLTVYLRQNDVPLPPIYGPTADEAL